MIISSYKIDRVKWDKCINQSPNSLIYSSVDYLDHLTDNWSAIIINDYEGVMPVAWRKKYGITYSYDVPFIQQLGLFSMGMNIPLNEVSSALFSMCRYGDYHFNFGNKVSGANSRANFILPLTSKYEDIANGFSNKVQTFLKF